MNLKDNTVYNRADNLVYVKSEGDLIYVICNKESQQDMVVERMTTDNCILDSYEEWDEDKDMKWILTFRVLDEYDMKPNLN
tara:strand:- start:215 stop:457 length:243 start_codon:yes stop_codon:yes gene_type:complete